METCVLIPQEFSLVLTAATASVDGRRGAGITAPTAGLSVEDRNANRLFEMRVDVWSNTRIPQGAVVYPFQGTIRLDKLEVYSYLDDNDIRHRFGCYDEITEVDRRRVRHCNWVRFLRASPKYTEEVNLIGTKIKGDPVYEVIKPIPPNTELVVYYLPERPEEVFFMPAVHYLRNSLYRRTMDTILEDSPLDLSMSLLSRVLITPPSDSDERKSVSGDSSASSSSLGSSSASSSDASSAGDIENLKRDPNVLRPTPGSGGTSPVEGTGAVSGGAGTDSAVSSASSPTASPPKKTRERTLLPCEVCGKAFDRPSLLKRHMRTHTGEKPHVCEVCGKGFSTSSSLNTHRRIHSGEKPHQCQVCGKRFTASSNLYYHRMTHIKEKPHKCQLCSKSFPTPGDLKSHMYVHNGSWPFKCHICNRGFSKHTNLKNHLFLHTGDKPHACELCHKRFALACNLRAHLKTHEGDPQEECVRCGKVYLASSQQIVHGFCSPCYQSSQGLPLVKRPSVQNGCKTVLPASATELKDGRTILSNEKSLCDSGEEESLFDKRTETRGDEDEEEEEEEEEEAMDEVEEHMVSGRGVVTSDEGCYSP